MFKKNRKKKKNNMASYATEAFRAVFSLHGKGSEYEIRPCVEEKPFIKATECSETHQDVKLKKVL